MKTYHLKQVKAIQGLNSHRSWECQITGKKITSNDDVVDEKKFYIDDGRGEGSNTKWFKSPTLAIKASLTNEEVKRHFVT